MSTDAHWMALALAQARRAGAGGEVPVGAVLVKDGALVASACNAPVALHDPSAHAEINALRAAGAALGNYRLDGCELFVTLEPCAMCAGAMIHARLRRVVFGAADPKTGAAGSVVDLFGDKRLNHHTMAEGGVMAGECQALLQSFFHDCRAAAREIAEPLRDDALRTPVERFAALSDYPFTPRYVSDLPSLGGWRMAYLDEGPRDAAVTLLCLHGAGEWSYLFRHLLPSPLVFPPRHSRESGNPRTLERPMDSRFRGNDDEMCACDSPQGERGKSAHEGLQIRILAPDLIGFGQSDKPKREAVHQWTWHRDVLLEWLDRLAPGPLILLHSPRAAELAALLSAAAPERFTRAVTVPEGSDPVPAAAWRTPFPDRGYEAGARALGGIPRQACGPDAAQAAQLIRQFIP
jgi:tRNA(adenine34) deaminase